MNGTAMPLTSRSETGRRSRPVKFRRAGSGHYYSDDGRFEIISVKDGAWDLYDDNDFVCMRDTKRGCVDKATAIVEKEERAAAVDLGAAGTVTAELFAVEVQWVNGTTTILEPRFESFDDAVAKADSVNNTIRRGMTPGWRQAYVVTADGTEV